MMVFSAIEESNSAMTSLTLPEEQGRTLGISARIDHFPAFGTGKPFEAKAAKICAMASGMHPMGA